MLCMTLCISVFFTLISIQFQLSLSLSYGQHLRSRAVANLLRKKDKSNFIQLVPATKLHGGQNVQKLVPALLSNVDLETPDSDVGLGDAEYAEAKSKPPRKDPTKGHQTPENVERVQETTGSLWPMGIILYVIDKDVYDSTTVSRISKAMSTIESVSCLKFRELAKKPEDDGVNSWLYFTNPRQERECQHVFERKNAETEVVLGFNCLRPEEILHTLLHALGFRDEVTNPQRDKYISIMWENIQPKYRDLFMIQDEYAGLVEYDPMSIMHFHDRAFSGNGAATIVAKVPGLQMTHTKSLSQLDIMSLKMSFNHECEKRTVVDLLNTCKHLIKQNDTNTALGAEHTSHTSEEKDTLDDDGNVKVSQEVKLKNQNLAFGALHQKPPRG